MIVYIKNMVCNRCILVVQQIFTDAGLPVRATRLGEVELSRKPTKAQKEQLEKKLTALGFEILDDQKHQTIETIKNILIQQLQAGELEEHFRLSDFLSKKLNREYSGISRLFSEVEGITIEQYFILQKIEKVKELLVYDELNLNQIAFHLGYSSTAHLVAQFKRITGLTTRHFKQLGAQHRHPLDKVKRN